MAQPTLKDMRMDLGVLQVDHGNAKRLGSRWLLICDVVGGLIGAMIAVALLVTVFS